MWSFGEDFGEWPVLIRCTKCSATRPGSKAIKKWTGVQSSGEHSFNLSGTHAFYMFAIAVRTKTIVLAICPENPYLLMTIEFLCRYFLHLRVCCAAPRAAWNQQLRSKSLSDWWITNLYVRLVRSGSKLASLCQFLGIIAPFPEGQDIKPIMEAFHGSLELFDQRHSL